MSPGSITLTEMPLAASSSASARAKVTTPALAAPYSAIPRAGWVTCEPFMPKRTIRPNPRARIPGRTAKASPTAEPRLASVSARYSAGVQRAKRLTTIGPTAWTSTSTGPRASAAATAAAAAAGSRKSAGTASAPASCSRTSASTASGGVPPGR